jgi:16S rRNA (guanine966-N2)-methyltransferase
VGIEALSRGAHMVYFVESSSRAARAMRSNLAKLGIHEGCEVMEREVKSALHLLESRPAACDFCFLDPPYRKQDDYEQVLTFLSRSPLLKAGSLVIAEHDKHFDPGEAFGALERSRKLRQGDSVLSFYGRAKEHKRNQEPEHGGPS